ncbi:MAG: T9SS type A sorting domain-containing protein [Bacteroidetes bacterium]|nr:T9SS type A sorting domain-containing protein [Bacteroidota bacterium]
MKKIYLSAIAIFASSVLSAQTAFWTNTSYKGAFPITDNTPATDWTNGWTNWDPENVNYGATTTTISANIVTSTTLSGIVHLVNNVAVTNNSTLTILPGTIIRGDKATKSCLIITRGAKIMAQGTAANPIIFTSNESIANGRAPGDWGGLVILGNGIINTACATCTASATKENYIEGFATTFPEILYGGNNNADNSGVLSYVRIEFSGVALSATPNSELNGLTMGGVGSGTKLDHIQCSFIGDDSFEWFGGAVDAKWLISFRSLDDDFDTDFGHQGRVQFGLIVRDKDISDAAGDSNGFESDNFNPGIGRLPLTKTVFSNITSIGPKRDGTVSLPVGEKFERAMFTRRNTAISIHNSLFTGWEKGWDLNGTTTADNYLSATDSGAVQNAVISTDVLYSLIGQPLATMQAYATIRNIDTTITSAGIGFVSGFPTALETTPDYRLISASPVSSGASFTNTVFGGTFVGINNITTFSDKIVSVYPNPASDVATLVIDAISTSVLNVSVYDLNGKLVASPVVDQTLQSGENTFTINTSNLNNGVYFVTLSSNNGKETVKLVVSK